MLWESIAADDVIAYLWKRLDLSPVTGGTLPGEEAKGAMARRFVLDDRRPTSVVSQGIYSVIKTDLTMARKDVSVCVHIKLYFQDTYLILGSLDGDGTEEREGENKSLARYALWLRYTVQFIPYLEWSFPRLGGYSHVARL